MHKKYRLRYSDFKNFIFERLDHYEDEYSKEFQDFFDYNFGNLHYKELIDEIKNIKRDN